MNDARYYIKSFIISVGGKSWMREEAWKIYSKACNERGQALRWVDPFAGGLSIPLFILPEAGALANDANPHLINFYNEISKTGMMPPIEQYGADINYPGEAKDIYLIKRQRFNEKIKLNEINDSEMAILFYYLNRAGYGGISRYNSNGEYNVPFRGKISNPRTDFSVEQEVFKDWEFTCADFTKVLNEVTDDDFVFADPPYDEVFNNYIKAGFSWDQQVVLAEKLSKLSSPILATNSATDRVIKLYTDLGFDVHFRMRGNFIQRPKVKNGDYKDFKEAIFTKNIKVDDGNNDSE